MTSPINSAISSLEELLSPDSKILTDSSDPTFRELLQRWSDIDLNTPAAIVLPVSEEDIQKTAIRVQWAIKSSIPFVTKSGGHSEWSTIGSEGIIIDLSRYIGIEVDPAAQTATLRGSILSKQVAVCLAEAGMFTALGNGNTVGAIPYFLGGGASITSSITGFGSDQIISARMISATGELLEVSERSHPDLLWALRGAGQFFGLVTQLVIQAYPLSLLENNKGTIWVGAFIFSLDRSKEVCSVMKVLMDDVTHGTGGLIMIMAPPPTRKPSLVVSARLIGDSTDAQEAFRSLFELQPLVTNGAEVPIQNTSDGREAIGAKGGFKRFGVAGLHHFDTDAFMKTVSLWEDMVAECPDAINTTFNFQWDSRPVKAPRFDSAMSLHKIRYWQNNIVWHTDIKNRSKVDEFNERSIAAMRSGHKEAEWVDFQNATRSGPIQYRYRGAERLARLRKLKKTWDPTGVFTTQLL